MQLSCHLTRELMLEGVQGIPHNFCKLDAGFSSRKQKTVVNCNPVPCDVLQKKSEEVWTSSGGRWGTPPGVPLESYDSMCMSRGINDVSAATRNLRERKNRRIKKATDLGVGDVHLGTDTISGQATESEGTKSTLGN